MAKERKELIVLDGITILLIAMLVVNGVAFALLYRWHNAQVFNENFSNRALYGDLLAEARSLKNILVDKDGAESWEKSTYGKAMAFQERGKKTYETAGLAIDYPSDYVSELTEDGRHLVLMTSAEADRLRDPDALPGEGPTTIAIDTYPLGGKSIIEWLKSAKESNFDLGDKEYSTVKLGDIPAVVYRWSGLYEALAYVVSGKDGNAVVLTATYITRSDEILRDFDLIISTLRAVQP